MTKNSQIKELLEKKQEFITELKRIKPPRGKMYSCGMHRQGVIYLRNQIKTIDYQINHLKNHD